MSSSRTLSGIRKDRVVVVVVGGWLEKEKERLVKKVRGKRFINNLLHT